MQEKIRVGISACLLGEKVRFDGGHKLDPYIVRTLGQYLDFIPICPEVELGLPTPREALRLVGETENPRLIFSRSGEDITERMLNWSHQRVRDLEEEELCGFIFKSRSPSSGMERVKLYDRNGVPQKRGVGLFARVFMEHFPLLPVEEEGRLHDPLLRENFVEAIFTLRRWRTAMKRGTMESLIEFHTRHKLLLMAHSPQLSREAGRLVGTSTDIPLHALLEKYQYILVSCIRTLPTRARHVNVLQHAIGYFKRQLTPEEKSEMSDIINSYRQGDIPLIVPVTLLNHYVRKYNQPYLKEQLYFSPHPLELGLRNHS